MKEIRFCLQCGKILEKRHKITYCSNLCQFGHRHQLWIGSWKKGDNDGNTGITAKNISRHIKKYLYEKCGSQCSICGWSEKHPITGNIPLEIDHIDGNSENNIEENLRLLCPNCHALTPFFKNLNKGKGRKWRMDKYIKNS